MKSDEPFGRGLLPSLAREGSVCFHPPDDPDCPEWKTHPFFDFGDCKGFVRMRVRAAACLCAKRSADIEPRRTCWSPTACASTAPMS